MVKEIFKKRVGNYLVGRTIGEVRDALPYRTRTRHCLNPLARFDLLDVLVRARTLK